MTAKEYLGQAYRLDQRINSKLEQIRSLRDLTTKATAKHPWKAEVSEDDTGVLPATISGWYEEVYEPDYSTLETA